MIRKRGLIGVRVLREKRLVLGARVAAAAIPAAFLLLLSRLSVALSGQKSNADSGKCSLSKNCGVTARLRPLARQFAPYSFSMCIKLLHLRSPFCYFCTESGAISSSTANFADRTARKPNASPRPSNPWSVLTLTTSESATGSPFSPRLRMQRAYPV